MTANGDVHFRVRGDLDTLVASFVWSAVDTSVTRATFGAVAVISRVGTAAGCINFNGRGSRALRLGLVGGRCGSGGGCCRGGRSRGRRGGRGGRLLCQHWLTWTLLTVDDEAEWSGAEEDAAVFVTGLMMPRSF